MALSALSGLSGYGGPCARSQAHDTIPHRGKLNQELAWRYSAVLGGRITGRDNAQDLPSGLLTAQELAPPRLRTQMSSVPAAPADLPYLALLPGRPAGLGLLYQVL